MGNSLSCFYPWFVKKRKGKFENRFILSACEETNVSSMSYQNDIKTILFLEKVDQRLKNSCFERYPEL